MSAWLTLAVGLSIALFAALTGWPVVRLVLRASERNSEGEQSQAEAVIAQEAPAPGEPTEAQGGDPPPDTRVSLRGGLWIGLLERFAVAGAVLMGQYTIVAAVVAVKALGRFREIQTPEDSERFVVGTLASLTWAMLIAGGASMLLAGTAVC